MSSLLVNRPLLKRDCNGVDLVEVFKYHPSHSIRELAALEMCSRASIQEKWKWAQMHIGIDRDEFGNAPWTIANTVLKRRREEDEVEEAHKPTKTRRGGFFIHKDWKAERDRVLDTTNRLRALHGLPPL